MIQCVLYCPGQLPRWGGRELLDAPLPPGAWLWADLEGFEPEYERLLLDLGYHPLAVEDTFTLQHQPKMQEFDDCLFAIVRGLDFNKAGHRLDTLKLAAFLGTDRLLTCHRAPMRSVRKVQERLRDGVAAPPGGPARLLYSLCDEVIDHYFPVLDEIAREIEEIEEAIFRQVERGQLEGILELRRSLGTLRRVMLPHRQVFSHLGNPTARFVDEGQALYFRDVYDNVMRLGDAIDQQRDQLGSVKDTYLSAVGQKTNEIMKVLTLFSAILLPLTFLAGLYGMNFEYMPELKQPWAYPALLGTMVATAVAMVVWFRRRGWW